MRSFPQSQQESSTTDRVLLAMAFAFAAVVTVSGSGCSAGATAKTDDSGIPDLPPYSGPKAKVTVRKVDWKVGGSGGASFTVEGPEGQRSKVTWTAQTSGYAQGLEDMLIRSLFGSERFIVLERAQFDSVRQEEGLRDEGWFREGSKSAKSNVDDADVEVYGSVVGWEPAAKGSGFGGGFVSWVSRFVGLGGMSVGKKTSRCSLELRIYDLRSSRILATTTVVGEGSSWSFGGGGLGLTRGLGLGGGLSQFEKTPMDAAIRKAIAQAVVEVVNRAPKKYFKYDDNASEPIAATGS